MNSHLPLGSLGKTNIEVSRICFGTLTIGPLQKKLSLDEGGELIAYAIGRGINFFDTAQLYRTYDYLREGMRKAGKHDIVISSKTYAYDRAAAQKAVEEARKQLDRDVVDIFMLHEQESIYTLKGHAEALEYLFECKAKGLVRAVGASMHHIAAVYGAVQVGLDVIHPIFNKNGLGVADGGGDAAANMEKAVRAAKAAGLGVFSMKALGGGNLFKQASECLIYCFDNPDLDSIAIGMQSKEEVDANIMFCEQHVFSDEMKAKIENRERRLLIEDWCRLCGNCIKRCKQNALSVKNGRMAVDMEKCVLCGYCSAECRDFAIKVI